MSEEPKVEKPKQIVSKINVIAQVSIVMDYDSHLAVQRSVLVAAQTSF